MNENIERAVYILEHNPATCQTIMIVGGYGNSADANIIYSGPKKDYVLPQRKGPTQIRKFHKKDVTIGTVYRARISGRDSNVRIDSVSHYGGWSATNLDTGRTIHIKSAAKLRAQVSQF